ncbi:unnamed protein product [Oikopleura dioica]|uniref:RING-type domain-containing protein n=1 Tax=Oikopleura dioica TaxID=34765 RepID=E4Y6W1_OIKDI|nr:unnamed protein product [Oikopleura dioica]
MNCGKAAFIEAVPKKPSSLFDELIKLPRIQSTEILVAELVKIVEGLQKITFRDYFLENEALNFPRDCSICLNPFVNEEELVKLKNCEHIFHKGCVVNAVKYCDACPLCKRPAISSA